MRRCGCAFAVDVEGDDARALARKTKCDAAADARACSSDDGKMFVEKTGHWYCPWALEDTSVTAHERNPDRTACPSRRCLRQVRRRDAGYKVSRQNMSRRPTYDPRTAAEKAFKAATTKPVEQPPPKPPSLPGVKEMVSLRIDRDVLDFFQEDGPGWQDRINAALRKAAGK